MTSSSEAEDSLANGQMLTRLFDLFDAAAGTSTGFLVAYSGGLDSHCLLCLTALWRQRSDRFGQFPLEAIHVDHRLQSDSTLWAQRCRQSCDELGIVLQVEQVDVINSGSGPEAAARDARYTAFEQATGKGVQLLQGHHASDQAETMLYRLCLGHGAEGLKGIPASRSLGEGHLLRPLLAAGLSREMIASLFGELREQREWPEYPVEDPSNQSDDFSRNYLRHRVLPLLEQRWPTAVTRMAGSAVYLAESALLNRTLARLDLQRSLEVPLQTVGSDFIAALPLTALCEDEDFSAARLANLLRHWLGKLNVQLAEKATESVVYAALRSLAAADTKAEVQAGSGQWLTLYRQTLFLRSFEPAQGSLKLAGLDSEQATAPHKTGDDSAPANEMVSELALPPKSAIVSCRPRNHPALSGGIKVDAVGRGRRCTLKRLLSERHVLPWQRDSLPILFYDEVPVCIPGVFVAKAAALDWPRKSSESSGSFVLRYSIQ